MFPAYCCAMAFLENREKKINDFDGMNLGRYHRKLSSQNRLWKIGRISPVRDMRKKVARKIISVSKGPIFSIGKLPFSVLYFV